MKRNTKGRFISKKEHDKPLIYFVLLTLIGIPYSFIWSQMSWEINWARAEPAIETIETIAPAEYAHEITLLAQEYDVDRNLAERIIFCESSFKENAVNENKGAKHYSVDRGLWQINDMYWADELAEVGLDYTELEAGFYLLDKYGTELWSASKSCWYEKM